MVGKRPRIIMIMTYRSMPREMRSRIMLMKRDKGLMLQE